MRQLCSPVDHPRLESCTTSDSRTVHNSTTTQLLCWLSQRLFTFTRRNLAHSVTAERTGWVNTHTFSNNKEATCFCQATHLMRYLVPYCIYIIKSSGNFLTTYINPVNIMETFAILWLPFLISFGQVRHLLITFHSSLMGFNDALLSRKWQATVHPLYKS